MVLNVKIYAPGMNELNPLQIQGYGVGYHHGGVIHPCSRSGWPVDFEMSGMPSISCLNLRVLRSDAR